MLFYIRVWVDEAALLNIEDFRKYVVKELLFRLKVEADGMILVGEPEITWYDMHDVNERAKVNWDESYEPPNTKWMVHAEQRGIRPVIPPPSKSLIEWADSLVRSAKKVV